MSGKHKTGVQREIKKLQNTTNHLIPRSCMERFVKETIQNCRCDASCRVTHDAVNILHEASEDHLIKQFQAANVFAAKAQRLTVTADDMKAVNEVRDILD